MTRMSFNLSRATAVSEEVGHGTPQAAEQIPWLPRVRRETGVIGEKLSQRKHDFLLQPK